jgi:hypothetical protein
VSSQVTATGSTMTYVTSTSNWPWGSFVVALLLIQVLIVKLRNRLRRRTAKSRAKQDEEARLIRDEYDLVGPVS